MGKFYLGHVSYNGDNFYGWQKQKDVPSIQESFYEAIRKSYPLGRIEVKATSRTDRGVHALAQVVKFLAPRLEDPSIVMEKVNSHLPPDIRITQCERIHKSFKVNYLPIFKEYLYFFSLNSQAHLDPFVGVPGFSDRLDLELMKKAANLYIGKKDFTHFQYRSDVKSDFKRNIMEARIVPAQELFPNGGFSQDVLCFHVKGEGFLKQMVRLMVGGLFMVGSSQTTLEELQMALNGEEVQTKPAFIAPSPGLFLYHIEFPEVQVHDRRMKVEDRRLFLSLFPKFELWKDHKKGPFLIQRPCDFSQTTSSEI
jgi:tRNA pseudouridine38-40 synthase